MKPVVLKSIVVLMAVVMVVWVVGLLSLVAHAEDCPAGVRTCKVLTVTPEEVQALVAPGGVFDQAVWANRSGMTGLVDAWKRKIETAPAGTVKGEEQK